MVYREKMTLAVKTIIFMVLIPEIIFGLLCLYFYLDPNWFPNGLTNSGILEIYGISVGIRLLCYLVAFGLFGIRERLQVGGK